MMKMKLKELNLLDKFLFDEAMEDRETYQNVISILLENEIDIGYGSGREALLYGNAEAKYWEFD